MTTDEHSLFEEEALSTIEAFRCQEKQYACHHDYSKTRNKKISPTLQSDRKLMLKWSYNVVDFFNLHRETAAIAMNYSDRFLQTDHGVDFLRDTDKYQLLCIVSLYLAVKVHESSSLTPKVFVEIGRGHYSVAQIETMETELLAALEWRVNPPTALSFVRLFLDLTPPTVLDHSMKASAYMLARAQTERAVSDYKLVPVEASKIAFASVQNSLEALGYTNGDLRLTAPFSSKQQEPQASELLELRIQLSAAITWEVSRMNLMPTGCYSKLQSTKTKANRDEIQQQSTPRSVLCHSFGS